MVNFCQGQVQLTRYGTIGVSVGILMGSRRACSRVLLSTPIAGTVRTTKPAANWQRATRIRAEDLMVSWLSDNKMELCQAQAIRSHASIVTRAAPCASSTLQTYTCVYYGK